MYSYYQSASPNEDTDEWKLKFIKLLNDKNRQELISREKKDRRDFEQLAALATRMGLYRYHFDSVIHLFLHLPAMLVLVP